MEFPRISQNVSLFFLFSRQQVVLPRKFRTTSNYIPTLPSLKKEISSTKLSNGSLKTNGSPSSNSLADETSNESETNGHHATTPHSHGLLLTRQALHTYQSNNHLVHYKYSAYSGSFHELPKWVYLVCQTFKKCSDHGMNSNYVNLSQEFTGGKLQRRSLWNRRRSRPDRWGDDAITSRLNNKTGIFIQRARHSIWSHVRPHRFKVIQTTILLSPARSWWHLHAGITQRRKTVRSKSNDCYGLLHRSRNGNIIAFLYSILGIKKMI